MWFNPMIGLFAICLKKKASNINAPIQEHEGICNGRNVSLVERDASLRIHSSLSSSQNSAQDSFRSKGLQDHSYCSSLEQSVMVPRSSGLVLQPPSSTSSKSRPTLSKTEEGYFIQIQRNLLFTPGCCQEQPLLERIFGQSCQQNL